MKKLRITVDGKVYDVTVEVLEDDEPIGTAAAGLGLGPAGPSPVLPPPRSAPAPVASPAPPAGGAVKGGGKDTLAAPLAGSVIKVFVTAGARIEEKAPVCLLEAMKMETYIYSSRTAKVATVCVKPGDAVAAGDPLIHFEPEG